VQQILHLVARTHPGLSPLADPDAAWWLWARLRSEFPDALAACLMPNHLHLILLGMLDEARWRLAALLAGFSRRLGGGCLWQRLPEAKPIPDLRHLAREVRYVHLNPCRAKLATDPLAWPWSSHRGLLGADVDPWVTPTRLANRIGWPRAGFGERIHAYVSGDPSVSVSGTPPPTAAPPSRWPAVPLDLVVVAASAATTSSTLAVRREAAVLLARDQGWNDRALIGEAIGVTRRGVNLIAARARPELLEPARLCLGDARLRSDRRQFAPLVDALRSRLAPKHPPQNFPIREVSPPMLGHPPQNFPSREV
jgi:hypothetical protein